MIIYNRFVSIDFISFSNGLSKQQDWFPSKGYYEVINTMIKYGYDITKSDILHSVYPYGDPRWYMF